MFSVPAVAAGRIVGGHPPRHQSSTRSIMNKADNKPAEDMSMEDILASIRKMIAQDQDVMDATRAERDSSLPSEEASADDEVLDLIDEMPEDGVTVREDTAPLSDTPPAWDSPPEENVADLSDGLGDDPLDLETEFAIDDGGHSRYSTSSANCRVHAIKALTVVGGGEAHL